MQCWDRVRNGVGQAVLLSGDPGIGKSRILSELRHALEAGGDRPLRLQCSPYHVNSAFYPVIDHFERWLQFEHLQPAGTKLDILETQLARQMGVSLGDVRLVAPLSRSRAIGKARTMTEQRVKEQTIRVLLEVIEASALQRPAAMLFEDAHWAMPVAGSPGGPDGSPANRPALAGDDVPSRVPVAWSDQQVRKCEVSKLTPVQSTAMVSSLASGKALPAGLVESIIAKAEGVPLWVEELTRSILDSTTLTEQDDRFAYVDNAASTTIPATLQDSLTARLDQAGPAKAIAQIGAAIGREFSYD